jgi:LmbE family N-acetylglucosaminyl deacetylase
MAIVAHPTNAFDMVGGTLVNHIERGDEVHVCFTHARMHEDAFRLADNIRTGDSSAVQEAVDAESEHHIRCAKEACAILGIENVSTIGCTAEILTYTPELVGKVATCIQQVRPDLLITHNPMENGGVPPHAVCGQIVLEGMRLARGARSNGLTPHRVAQLFFICTPGSTTWLDAMSVNRFPAIQIDVTAHVEKKVKALSKLDAQNYTPQMAGKVVEATGGMAAVHQCVGYTEQFQPFYPEVYHHLPVSEYNLRLSQELHKDASRRIRFVVPYLDDLMKDR